VCPVPSACWLPGPCYGVPRGTSSTASWTRCAPPEPAFLPEARSPGDGVTVPEAGAAPSGAQPQGWLESHPIRRFA